MTPEEKAKRLVEKFNRYTFGGEDVSSKQVAITCALIAVGEILSLGASGDLKPEFYKYWKQVKDELNKL